jgi:CRP-like cAMP-binding protein
MAALAARLNRIAPGQNLAPLFDCVIEQTRFDRDQPLWAEPNPSNRLYVIDEGFAFDFTILLGGKRHIFDFYGPGAICNWTRPERGDVPENIVFKARTDVLVLERSRVDELLARDPALASAVQGHELARAMRVSQRVRALISLPAKDRLRMLLLDIAQEYGWTDTSRRWLAMPLTQEEIGDLIGSTSVHVSRTFSSLEQSGEIERRGNAFRLVGIDDMQRRMSYRRFG